MLSSVGEFVSELLLELTFSQPFLGRRDGSSCLPRFKGQTSSSSPAEPTDFLDPKKVFFFRFNRAVRGIGMPFLRM